MKCDIKLRIYFLCAFAMELPILKAEKPTRAVHLYTEEVEQGAGGAGV